MAAPSLRVSTRGFFGCDWEPTSCRRHDAPWCSSACSGVPQQEFSRDPAFASVRDDPEFLAVVKGWREARL